MKNAVIYETGKPKSGELELINSMTRRPFAEDELYVFSVTLCDNDIDRDFERFTLNALNSLAKMYVGKTGIFDHSMKGKDQVARIFKCEVETLPSTFTKDGLPYSRLIARAYMPRTSKNEELIIDIDAGINKEVSVGCSMASAICSICGTDRRTGCSHKKGRHYKKDGKKQICHTILDNPSDAFEWSFVAVPAQPKAGVTKSFEPKDMSAHSELFKVLAKKLNMDPENAEGIEAAVDRLNLLAQKGEDYVEDLKSRALGEIATLYGDISADAFKSAMNSMESENLISFCHSLHNRYLSRTLPRPQTAASKSEEPAKDNQNFII